jgi:hypothetical protein
MDEDTAVSAEMTERRSYWIFGIQKTLHELKRAYNLNPVRRFDSTEAFYNGNVRISSTSPNLSVESEKAIFM